MRNTSIGQPLPSAFRLQNGAPSCHVEEGEAASPSPNDDKEAGEKVVARSGDGKRKRQTLEPEVIVAQSGSAQSDEQLPPTEPASVSASLADLIQQAVTSEVQKALNSQQDSPHVDGGQRVEGQVPLPCDHAHNTSIPIGLPPPGDRQPGGFDATCDQQNQSVHGESTMGRQTPNHTSGSHPADVLVASLNQLINKSLSPSTASTYEKALAVFKNFLILYFLSTRLPTPSVVLALYATYLHSFIFALIYIS